jgi:hypothetical protein
MRSLVFDGQDVDVREEPEASPAISKPAAPRVAVGVSATVLGAVKIHVVAAV